MLSKSRRIPRKDFLLIKNKGDFVSDNLLSLRFLKQVDGKSRFSFSVSKKVSNKAYIRNKLRRMGYLVAVEYLDKTCPALIHTSFKKIPESKNTFSKSFCAMLSLAKLLK